jgi:hypothetical protein
LIAWMADCPPPILADQAPLAHFAPSRLRTRAESPPGFARSRNWNLAFLKPLPAHPPDACPRQTPPDGSTYPVVKERPGLLCLLSPARRFSVDQATSGVLSRSPASIGGKPGL